MIAMDTLGYGTTVHTPDWTSRLHNCLADFTDLCSEFTRYIAPSYRHDRADRSVQMRLYTLNKRHFALVFIAFFACLSVSVVIGLLGPPVMEYSVTNASSTMKPGSNKLTGPFSLKSPPVSTFHQQLWLTARILTDHSGSFELPLSVSVLIRGLSEDDQNVDDALYYSRAQNHSRELICAATCDDIIVLHLGYLSYTNYAITLQIYGLDTIKYPVQEIEFRFTTYHASFTQLEIWLRFSFLFLTFLVTCFFGHSLRKFSLHDWSIEQKWMTLLLPLLLLYDNPLFPLTFLINSCIPGIVDVLFQTTFLCALLLYWLCLYHGVRQIKRTLTMFYLPKFLLVGLLWVSVITVLSWQSYQQLNDPTYDYALDSGNYFGYMIYLYVVGGLYLLYLLYLLIRAYTELRSLPYLDLRLKFMTVLMLIVVTVSLVITGLRFGLRPLHENFVAELSTKFHNSAEFAAFYGLLNFYLFTMAFVYSPSRNAVYESHFKDNPALSMLNDSDDEVVYGEDMSLTRNKPATKYDSDEEAFN